MPGHNYIDSINEGTNARFGGEVIQIVAIGTNTPAASNCDMQGYARGAFLINTTGNGTGNTIYVNLGTTTLASWTTLTVT